MATLYLPGVISKEADAKVANWSASIPGAEWFGGFAYRKADDPYCDAGSRCVHVMVTLDHGLRRVIHAIVDLQSDRVVHPLYDPELTRPVSDADPYPEPAS